MDPTRITTAALRSSGSALRNAELESNNDILDANLHEIHTSYSAVGGGRSIPGTVLTDESSTMQTEMNRLEAMLSQLFPRQTLNPFT